MPATKEHATVHTACEVSYTVGHADYGTINIPVGTKVFRHVVNGKKSNWFLADDEIAKLTPESCKIDGKPSNFFLHDAIHYGINLPNANVTKEGNPQAKHIAKHY
jgi:hypothetical protein